MGKKAEWILTLVLIAGIGTGSFMWLEANLHSATIAVNAVMSLVIGIFVTIIVERLLL